jgi:hypothetical protein
VAATVGDKPCTPAAGEWSCKQVRPQPLIVLTFDRIMAPSSIFRDNFRIVSGSSGSLAFKQVRVDPVERAIYMTISAPLTAGAYRLKIKSVDDTRNQLAAFDGTRFEGETTLVFEVAGSDPPQTEIDPPQKDVPVTKEERACAAIGTLSASCTGAKCHGDSKGTPPMMGLSLINYTAIAATAIGRGSSLVQPADDPGGPGRITSDFPTGLSIIASPGEGDGSARSFLMYKILMDGRERPGGEAIAKDLARMSAELRKRIPGAPMPHDSLAPEQGATIFSPLPLTTVRLIRQWIDDGAPKCGAAPMGDAGTDATMMDAPMDSADSTVTDTAVSDAKGDVGADG